MTTYLGVRASSALLPRDDRAGAGVSDSVRVFVVSNHNGNDGGNAAVSAYAARPDLPERKHPAWAC